jgi:hypothetical protein
VVLVVLVEQVDLSMVLLRQSTELPAIRAPLALAPPVALAALLVWLSLELEQVALVAMFLDLQQSPALPGCRARSSSTGNELQIQILTTHRTPFRGHGHAFASR